MLSISAWGMHSSKRKHNIKPSRVKHLKQVKQEKQELFSNASSANTADNAIVHGSRANTLAYFLPARFEFTAKATPVHQQHAMRSGRRGGGIVARLHTRTIFLNVMQQTGRVVRLTHIPRGEQLSSTHEQRSPTLSSKGGGGSGSAAWRAACNFSQLTCRSLI